MTNPRARNNKRYGVHIVGTDKVFVVSVNPLMGFREIEANSICNFCSRQLNKLAVKIDMQTKGVIPVNLTFMVTPTLDVNRDDIYIDKGEI